MWELVEATPSAHGMLELYTHGHKEYLIRFDGIELMNSLLHASEDVLGEMAAAFCRTAQPRILIGGLGLGFTLKACVQALQHSKRCADLSVAELTAQIIDWYGRYFQKMQGLAPDCAQLIGGDVYQVIEAGGLYDMICLDIDNGPSYLASAHNSRMYDESGLDFLRRHLQPQGAALIWSAQTEAALATAAQSAALLCYEREVAMPLNGRIFSHYIYLLCSTAPETELLQKYQLRLM
ncbi:hypothetical protein V8J88_18010 [Massilia sp. W12]|uniref:hypothetical protein n=1 Tax=Massilia sp. W12 TaxID=3126507 RepID=UPI0030D122B8